jgi:hypothetical protein
MCRTPLAFTLGQRKKESEKNDTEVNEWQEKAEES